MYKIFFKNISDKYLQNNLAKPKILYNILQKRKVLMHVENFFNIEN